MICSFIPFHAAKHIARPLLRQTHFPTRTRYHRLWAAFQSTMTDSSRESSDDQIFKYAPIEEAESLERYRPGGYHPLVIGDTVKDRYRIVHKLGHGTYSTTWLCQDGQSNSYVALKVGTGDANFQEAEVLANLNPGPSHHPGRAMIPTVQDRFILDGINGSHPCYVTAPAMCSLSGAKDASNNRLFKASTARSIIAQLVLAVSYVHDMGIVHGDLHMGNVLLRLPSAFTGLSIEQVYEKHGTPNSQAVTRLDGSPLSPNVPPTATPPIWLGKASDELLPSETRVLLTDFGEAFSPSTTTQRESYTPLSVTPPEVRFPVDQGQGQDKGLSFPSDIWTLGCTVWAILGQKPLFEDFLATEDDITAEWIDVIGKLPRGWWERWEARYEYFDESGHPRSDRYVRSWEERFERHIQQARRDAGIETVEADEKEAIRDMLSSMLVFRPEMRATVMGVLECEWMVKWALPEYRRAFL